MGAAWLSAATKPESAEEDVKMFEGSKSVGGKSGLYRITRTAEAKAGQGGKLPCWC